VTIVSERIINDLQFCRRTYFVFKLQFAEGDPVTYRLLAFILYRRLLWSLFPVYCH